MPIGKKSTNQSTKSVVLIKDIVIPAGTIFTPAPLKTERSLDHVEHVIGLTDNTYGSLTYCVDPDCKDELSDYFKVVR